MFAHPLQANEALRLLLPHDAAELFALIERNRDRLREWMPWLDGTRSVDDVRAFITRSVRELADNGAFQAGITLDGRIVGVIGLHLIDWRNREVSLGYYLDAAAEGRGLMTRAVRAVTMYALATLDLHRVEVRCATTNRRSCAVVERLGFTREGTLRQSGCLYGRYVDEAVYSLLQNEVDRFELPQR